MCRSCLAPSGTPGLWLCLLLRSALPCIAPMCACSAAGTCPSMTAWLCSSLCSPRNNICCKGLSRGYGVQLLHLSHVNQFIFVTWNSSRTSGKTASSSVLHEIRTVGVHLDELEIPPVDKMVQAIIIKLQHSQLGQLASRYTMIPTWNSLLIITFSFQNYLEHVTNLLQAGHRTMLTILLG